MAHQIITIRNQSDNRRQTIQNQPDNRRQTIQKAGRDIINIETVGDNARIGGGS